MATVDALKKGKGTPPTRAEAPANTRKPSRDKAQPKVNLQVKVTQDVMQDFRETAARTFNFENGANSRLFMRMWEFYRENH